MCCSWLPHLYCQGATWHLHVEMNYKYFKGKYSKRNHLKPHALSFLPNLLFYLNFQFINSTSCIQKNSSLTHPSVVSTTFKQWKKYVLMIFFFLNPTSSSHRQTCPQILLILPRISLLSYHLTSILAPLESVCIMPAESSF